MTSKPEQPVDERLTGAHDLALSALHEITPADTVGPAAGYTAEDDGAVSLRFHTRLSGYPGWFWTVSVAVVEGADPTVLEVELLPGEGALLAPDWVPWATRLAEYQAAQVAAAVIDEDDDDLDEDDDDDTDDVDDEVDDDEDEPKARFHAGDLDGVDIDELDADHPDAADDDPDAADDDLDETDDDEPDRSDEDEDEGDRSY
ncbi:DUF3027 domain-containing protein [Microbacterium sp. lyk4-40-TSB-66]|uniref:DUF3027 domain-containing protein n=1 Tax=Microbacterium sp. lyk4-40-TSB-66 TaxID=3040294 RepID=UPI00254C1DCC|nr:DUF3027 domain-containing protein [Microbacterium sp. lyk4-40-TSB-66]